MRPLLRAEEVAKLLRVSRWRVYELARRGRLPAVRLGRSVRFDQRALEQLLRSRWAAENACQDTRERPGP